MGLIPFQACCEPHTLTTLVPNPSGPNDCNVSLPNPYTSSDMVRVHWSVPSLVSNNLKLLYTCNNIWSNKSLGICNGFVISLLADLCYAKEVNITNL